MATTHKNRYFITFIISNDIFLKNTFNIKISRYYGLKLQKSFKFDFKSFVSMAPGNFETESLRKQIYDQYQDKQIYFWKAFWKKRKQPRKNKWSCLSNVCLNIFYPYLSLQFAWWRLKLPIYIPDFSTFQTKKSLQMRN